MTWEGRAPTRIRAACAGYDGPVDKLVCPDCFSILALEAMDGDGAPLAEANLACISDGDYKDFKAGRIANETKWPSSLLLHKTKRSHTTRIPWYPAEAKGQKTARPPSADPVTGGCLCGTNRYQISSGMVGEIQHCHCSQCRKCHGAAFASWTPVKRTNFSWTTNQDSLVKVRISDEASRITCSKCGTSLQMVYDWQDDTVWPAVGSFDDASVPSHERVEEGLYRVVHICVKSKAPWLILPPDSSDRLDYAF